MSEVETNPQNPEIVPPSEPTGDLELTTPEKSVLPPRPWGTWATIGWTLICIVAMFAAQIVGLIVFVLLLCCTFNMIGMEWSLSGRPAFTLAWSAIGLCRFS